MVRIKIDKIVIHVEDEEITKKLKELNKVLDDILKKLRRIRRGRYGGLVY